MARSSAVASVREIEGLLRGLADRLAGLPDLPIPAGRAYASLHVDLFRHDGDGHSNAALREFIEALTVGLGLESPALDGRSYKTGQCFDPVRVCGYLKARTPVVDLDD